MVVAGLVVILAAVVVMMAAPGASWRRVAQGTSPPPTPPIGPAVGLDTEIEVESEAEGGEPARHSLRPWVLRGIDIEEAKLWIDRGFDADHAYLLRSLDVDPRTASRLRKAGLDDSSLVTLIEEASFRHHTSIDDLVALAERAPHLAPIAVAWMELGVDADRACRPAAAIRPLASRRNARAARPAPPRRRSRQPATTWRWPGRTLRRTTAARHPCPIRRPATHPRRRP